MFSCWIFQILNGSDTVALTCDFAEDFVYQIGKLFFEDDDQTDQNHQNQDDLHNTHRILFHRKFFYILPHIFICHLTFPFSVLQSYPP